MYLTQIYVKNMAFALADTMHKKREHFVWLRGSENLTDER